MDTQQKEQYLQHWQIRNALLIALLSIIKNIICNFIWLNCNYTTALLNSWFWLAQMVLSSVIVDIMRLSLRRYLWDESLVQGFTFLFTRFTLDQPWSDYCWVNFWHWVGGHAQCPIPLLQHSGSWAELMVCLMQDGRGNLNPPWPPGTRTRCRRDGGKHIVWLCSSQCHQVLQSSRRKMALTKVYNVQGISKRHFCCNMKVVEMKTQMYISDQDQMLVVKRQQKWTEKHTDVRNF